MPRIGPTTLCCRAGYGSVSWGSISRLRYIPLIHPRNRQNTKAPFAYVSPLKTQLRYFVVLFVILGNRGIGHLLCKDELLKASLSLSHARSVLITTGFPTHFNHEPPEETDGPPGAIALAGFLQALGKGVSMVVDQRALSLFQKLVEEAVEQGERSEEGGRWEESVRSFCCALDMGIGRP